VLSAAAARLVLELQLLAAGEVQRQQQQQQPEQLHAVGLMLDCHNMLVYQIRALSHIGCSSSSSSSSCLPPEVLQQAGLQLLQALAAPLQHLQLSSASASPMNKMLFGQALLDEQLYALRSAAIGFNAAVSSPTSIGVPV
jgi:hypothetical protein